MKKLETLAVFLCTETSLVSIYSPFIEVLFLGCHRLALLVSFLVLQSCFSITVVVAVEWLLSLVNFLGNTNLFIYFLVSLIFFVSVEIGFYFHVHVVFFLTIFFQFLLVLRYALTLPFLRYSFWPNTAFVNVVCTIVNWGCTRFKWRKYNNNNNNNMWGRGWRVIIRWTMGIVLWENDILVVHD